MQRKRTSWIWCAALAVVTVGSLIPATSSNTTPAKTVAQNLEQRRLYIRTGTLFTKEGVPISLSSFDATIQSDKSPQGASVTDAKQIKEVLVDSGTVFVRAADLARLLKSHVPPDKITELAVQTENNELKLSGKLKKAIPVHFEIKGPVSVRPDGLLALHESTMKVDKLPFKGLAKMLGIDPANTVGDSSEKGIRAENDQLIFDPNLLWGLSVKGKLTGAKVTNIGLMLSYGTVRRTVQRASR